MSKCSSCWNLDVGNFVATKTCFDMYPKVLCCPISVTMLYQTIFLSIHTTRTKLTAMPLKMDWIWSQEFCFSTWTRQVWRFCHVGLLWILTFTSVQAQMAVAYCSNLTEGFFFYTLTYTTVYLKYLDAKQLLLFIRAMFDLDCYWLDVFCLVFCEFG